MRMRHALALLAALACATGFAQETERPMNILLNPSFEFHAFEPHRLGVSGSFSSHDIAFWSSAASPLE